MTLLWELIYVSRAGLPDLNFNQLVVIIRVFRINLRVLDLVDAKYCRIILVLYFLVEKCL